MLDLSGKDDKKKVVSISPDFAESLLFHNAFFSNFVLTHLQSIWETFLTLWYNLKNTLEHFIKF